MLMLFLTSFVLLQLCFSDMTVLKLEAEKGAFTGERNKRSDASEGEVVTLKDEQTVSHIFSTLSLCKVQVSNVRYSDGSSADVCTVSIGGEDVGKFRSTAEPSTSTDLWNNFYNSGTLGSTFVETGRHLIMITVMATDELGVELDFIELIVDCAEGSAEEEASSRSDFVPYSSFITLLAAIISACATSCYCLSKT